MTESNPYAAPISEVSIASGQRNVGLFREICNSFVAAIIILLTVWLSMKLLVVLNVPRRPPEGYIFSFIDYQLLFIRGFGDLVSDHYFVLTVLLTLAALATRYTYRLTRKTQLTLSVVPVAIYITVYISLAFNNTHSLNLGAFGLLLTIHYLLVAPSTIMVGRLLSPKWELANQQNRISWFIINLLTGIALFEGSFWHMWLVKEVGV